MARQMIEELKPGEPVDAVFLVSECSLRMARNGSSYLTLTLRDRTGEIQGRLWDASEAIAGARARLNPTGTSCSSIFAASPAPRPKACACETFCRHARATPTR